MFSKFAKKSFGSLTSLCIYSKFTDFSGVCYQFNKEGWFQSSTPGTHGGLQLILIAKTEEYTSGPKSMNEGFTVGIRHISEMLKKKC